MTIAPVPQVISRNRPGLAGGLIAGTPVLTLAGELPVEYLAPGDRIITRDSGLATLVDIRLNDVTCGLVSFKAGSLGHTRPDIDLSVGPDTPVLIRDWRAAALFGRSSALVPAARLVDGGFVRACAPERQRLITLVFELAHVIYAGGLEIGAAN